MHVILLRLALGLYFVGFVHSALTALNRKQTFFRPALISVFCGFVLHVISIVLGAMEVRYLPLTQQYEEFSFFGALAALGFLIAYAKYRTAIAPLSVFAFPLIFVMTFLANLFYDPSRSIPPVLRRNWIYVHVPMLFFGYAALFIAFAAAIMYLIQERGLKSKHVMRFRLPSLEVCDDLAYRSLAIGFPLITLGIVTGALWAQSVWGVWMQDAKVLFSFLTWFVYLLLIHYRLIAGWRGKKAAYLSIVGFIGVLVTFLGANYFGGLHTFDQ